MDFHFIQMADPQFGMFASISEYTDEDVAERHARGLLVRKAPERITGFADETRLYTAAIEATNHLNPAFAVVCGDLVHDAANQAQIDELIRVTSTLDGSIPMRLVSGNHDVGEAPTPDSLALYRQRFGPDNYSFDHGDCHFVVINSSVAFDPVNVPAEWDRIVQFMIDDLGAARGVGRNTSYCSRIIRCSRSMPLKPTACGPSRSSDATLSSGYSGTSMRQRYLPDTCTRTSTPTMAG